MRVGIDTQRARSRYNVDRRFENATIADDVKVIEFVDYTGTGGNVGVLERPPADHWNLTPGNALGVDYTAATSYYRALAGSKSSGPYLVIMGEFPADRYDDSGDPISDQKVSLAGMFDGSDVQMLPQGGARNLVHNTAAMFKDCRSLRHWGPEALTAAGFANVRDPEAHRRLRSNGLSEVSFLLNLAPADMRQMWMGATAYDGTAVNAISWENLATELSASHFATGCNFAPHVVNALVDRLHFQWKRGQLRAPLRNVNLGNGTVTGDVALRARELRSAGVEITGITIE